MSRTLALTTRAEEDILRAAGGISNPLVASRWLTRVLAHIAKLSDSAEWYGLADESDELGVELRETFFGKKSGKYRIVYQIVGDVVRVITVRRGSRDRLTTDDL